MTIPVTVKGLSRSFPSGETIIQAVQDVHFDVHQGELVAIVGSSGSGKSTLLSFQLFAEYTALENVLFPLELQGKVSYEEAVQKATTLLSRLGLGDRLHHKPAKMSGGEQQRVAIARAFVTQPPILFADEPTGNLDRETGMVVEKLLVDLQRETATTVILVTHDLELAKKADRILEMSGGRLSERS